MSWLDGIATDTDLNNQQNAIEFENEPPKPSTFTNAGSATVKGLQLGGIKTLIKMSNFNNPNVADPDAAKQLQELTADEKPLRDKYLVDSVKNLTPNPQTVGIAGQILGPIADIIPRTVVGGLVGGPLGAGAAAGLPEYDASKAVAISEGIDESTATKKGLIDASVMGAGAMLPGSVLKNIWGDAAFSIGANVGLGVASRAATSKLLADNGYETQAEQYKAFDKTAMVIDGILGTAFFGVARLSKTAPDIVDAALTQNSAMHLEHGTTPGAPVDGKSNVLHQQTLEEAMQQLVEGKPVSVSKKIEEATFIMQPRGVRNNNPGNIIADGTEWQGQVKGEDGKFASFKTPEYGIRALAKNLLTYQDKHGLNTVAEIINRWAPPSENNVAAYVASVSKSLAVEPNAPLNLRNKEVLSKLTSAIIKHENGTNPYSGEVIGKGIDGALGSIPIDNAAVSVRNHLASREDLPPQIKESLAVKYEQSAALKADFDKKINEILAESGITQKPMIPVDMRGADRAADKIMADYAGDVSRIKDLNRATIVVDNFDQAQTAIQNAQTKFGELIDLRNNLAPDSPPLNASGYRDIKMNMDLGNGHIAELQINYPEMIEAKKQAHKLYERAEAITRKANSEDRDLNLADAKERLELRAQQSKIYADAWDAANLLRNSDSLNSVPFLSNEDTGNRRSLSPSQARQTPSNVQDANTPSTLANSVPGGNESGNLSIFNTPSVLNIPRNHLGFNSKAFTERGNRIDTQFIVMDATELTTSHDNNLTPNSNYPQDLQPRDRTRDASEAQISRIENNINPELLAESPKASDGSPIVGPDGVVESGNARTIALRRAYEAGKAEKYREWLRQNAARFGFDESAITEIKNPVLVRLRNTEVDRDEFARQANESAVASLSVTELARSDANRMGSLEGMISNEDGSINFNGSGMFVRRFMQEAVAPTEQGAMITPDGRLSQQGEARIRNAVFAKAYGDSEIVGMMAESTDANIKNILNGMLRAAPAVAKLREMISEGARFNMDIAPMLVQAVREFSDIRAKGYSVEQFLAQQNMFDIGMTPELNNLLVGLQENSKAPKRIADMVNQLVKSIDNLGDPKQGSMFGDIAPPKAQDLIADTVENMRTQGAKASGDLFNSPEYSSAKQVAELDPSMKITLDDGQEVNVQDALLLAENDLKQANNDSLAFEAAVTCFTRTG